MNSLPMGLLLLAQVQTADAWEQTFFGLDDGQRFVVIVVAIGCATGILLGTIGIISSAVNSVHRRRAEMDLKRDMIERGMSADEIGKIMEAAPPPEDATDRWIASWGKKKSAGG